MDIMDRIKQQVDSNPIMVYMKGTPEMPQCGFSARTVQALKACGAEFGYVNIFEDPEVYQNLPRFSNWPTFPQVYFNSELIGGCDITLELFKRGELQKMVSDVMEKKRA